jgi:hypothetical protein
MTLACQSDPDLFFSDKREEIALAKALCRDCPMLEACREAGWGQEYGVFGGMDPADRMATDPDRQKTGIKLAEEISAALDDYAAGLDPQARERATQNPGVCIVASCTKPRRRYGNHGGFSIRCTTHDRYYYSTGNPIRKARQARFCSTEGCENRVTRTAKRCKDCRQRDKQARQCATEGCQKRASKPGEKCPDCNRKERERLINDVVLLRNSGFSYLEIAKMTGVSRHTVVGIVRRHGEKAT